MAFLSIGVPSFPTDVRFGHYCGLNRAPAASANVANAPAVYSRCFHPENLARIRSPPWFLREQHRGSVTVPASADGREPQSADTGA